MRMKRNWSYRLSLAILLLCVFQIASVSVAGELNSYGVQTDNPYVVSRFILDGQSIDEVIVPGRPPESYRVPAAIIPETAAGTKTLSTVPAFDWSYGCSATAAAMMFGYYDNTGYPNLYAGPTNGGVCPMTNAVWGKGESPLSATHQGLDGRTIKGHVDDYWVAYDSTAPDPFIGNWTEHVQGECTGDFMGTNQSSKANTDGSTTFWYYTDGSPTYDYTGVEPGKRDGCHGMKLFFASRGYTVVSNYSQYIMGHSGNTKGFTFENYKQEIDAGRPVLIQLVGHTMLGYGYNDTGSVVYLRDTWDYLSHSMTWGGSYSSMQQTGVTVFVPSQSVAKTPVLAASFVGLGLFVYNSDGSWTGTTSAIPENLIYFGSTLYVDFGASYGLQKWNGAAWTQLTSANPRSMVASDSALYVDLTSYGIWKWNGTGWSGQLTSLNAENMAASGSLLYVDLGASWGLWRWNGTAWSGQLTSSNPDKIAVVNPSLTGSPVLAASFVGLGLFVYNSDGSWRGITSAIPENLIYVGSMLYVDFGASYGLQKWNGAAWTQLTSANPRSMVASNSVLYVDLTSYGLYKWNGTAWSGLTSLNAENMAASGLSLYVDFGASNGLWKWNGTGWSGQLTSSNPDKIAVAN